MYNTITLDYYGFYDEEDGKLLLEEAAAEAAAVQKEVEEWEKREALKKSIGSSFLS